VAKDDIDAWARKRADEYDRMKRHSEELAARTRSLEKSLRKETARADEAEELLDRYSVIKAEDTKTPKWLKAKGRGRAHRAKAVLMLSDLHLDEVVDLHEMDGVNGYDRETAHRRLERVINGAVDLLKNYTSGVAIEGMLAALNGDIVTGSIHDELDRTNEAPVMATVAHWVPHIASALTYLADEVGLVHVPCKTGNHDRFYMKTPTKQRAESSVAWVLYNWLADTLRGDDRITFDISPSDESLVDVYDTTFLLHHGDDFRSQGGVGGLYPALLKWILRKHDYYSIVKRDFDYALLGHWHQELWGQDFVVNNSLKGYDQFARRGGFKFKPPSQAMFLVTPERGMGHRYTVHAE
jgi:hypothetical protein